MPKFEAYNHIKQIRIKKNMSAKELSRLSGVSASTISKLENGGYQPSIEVCNKLAEALGVEPDQIRGLDHPYVQSKLNPPRWGGDYLCAYRTSIRSPYKYQVFHYDILKREWTFTDGTGTGRVDPNVIKWWATIEPAPEI